MYNAIDGNQYDPQEDNLREIAIVERINEAENIYLKQLKGEKVEIIIRDSLELVADQCVNPIIHFLWKEHANINCYKKTNSKNENVYCDLMTSPWAHLTLADIQKIDPTCLLLPTLLYADGVTTGMNGKANLIPVMMTLGWYSRGFFKKDFSKMIIGYIDKLSDILYQNFN